jgi:RNA polymerase sigma-70 factor (ECF subfamily)
MENIQLSIEELVIGFSDELFRWALYKTGDSAVAEDLVQDTFYAAIKSSGTFRQNSQVKTWLFAILKNKITDHYRKSFRNPEISESKLAGDNENILAELFDENGTWKVQPTSSLWDDQEANLLDNPGFAEMLFHCLDDLPEQWNAIVKMKYLDEKDGNEICKELDISPSNFWQILHRSKLKLKICLESKWKKSF